MIGPFKGQYRFLSNFFPCTINYQGSIYPSVEHAYQAAKFDNVSRRRAILAAKSATEARSLGRIKEGIRPDWDNIRLEVMEELLRIKFSDEDLAHKLISTGDEELIEVNWWHDTFWGVFEDKGANHLGKLLMQIRSKLQDR